MKGAILCLLNLPSEILFVDTATGEMSEILQNRFTITKQECLPVGCMPTAAVAILGGGVFPQTRHPSPLKTDTPPGQTHPPPPQTKHPPPQTRHPPFQTTPPTPRPTPPPFVDRMSDTCP